MTYSYPRGRGPAWNDAALALGFAVLALVVDVAPLRSTLLATIPLVVAWSVVTLHFPTRVDLDDLGVAFHAYGRVHRFAWSELDRVSVRRFVVRDRVLVRLEGPRERTSWARGRYWITSSMSGFTDLVTQLERRSQRAPHP